MFWKNILLQKQSLVLVYLCYVTLAQKKTVEKCDIFFIKLVFPGLPARVTTTFSFSSFSFWDIDGYGISTNMPFVHVKANMCDYYYIRYQREGNLTWRNVHAGNTSLRLLESKWQPC